MELRDTLRTIRDSRLGLALGAMNDAEVAKVAETFGLPKDASKYKVADAIATQFADVLKHLIDFI